MQSKISVLFLALILSLCAACSRTSLQTGPIKDSVNQIIGRHDKYVDADESLKKADKETAKNESLQVKNMMVPDSIEAGALADPLKSVMNRHDAYVKEDSKLAGVSRRVFLRSTKILRDTLAEAGQ